MITSTSSALGDGDRSCANMVNTSVRNIPSQQKFRFIKRLTVSNADFDAKRFAVASAGLSRSHCAVDGLSSALRQRTLQCPRPVLLAAEVTPPGRPTQARKPNCTEKPFWPETIPSKGPTGYSRPQTQPRDN